MMAVSSSSKIYRDALKFLGELIESLVGGKNEDTGEGFVILTINCNLGEI
jgi:hypothetical protein